MAGADHPVVSKSLVIGVGNRVRGDDAVGPLVADELRETYGGVIPTMICDGDLSDLVLQWSAATNVVIIDAMVSSHRRPGMTLEVDALASPLPTGKSMISSHGVGLAEAIELGRLLGRLPRSLRIIGVEARSFDLFDPVTPEVAAVVPALAEKIFHRLSGPGV